MASGREWCDVIAIVMKMMMRGATIIEKLDMLSMSVIAETYPGPSDSGWDMFQYLGTGNYPFLTVGVRW